MGSSATVPVEREYDGKRRIAGIVLWVWCDVLAIASGVLLCVLAFTDHDRGSTADPNQVFHHYTLVHDQGVGIIGFVGIPALIALLLAPLLYLKSTRRSHGADHLATGLVVVSCLQCLGALIIEGIVALPVAVLTVAAVSFAPLHPPA
jgi:hypothetical protein